MLQKRLLFFLCSLFKQDHFILWHWCILSFLAPSGEAALFLFLIERMRLSLSPHPQLSVIAHVPIPAHFSAQTNSSLEIILLILTRAT
jgi:hypothetical protein